SVSVSVPPTRHFLSFNTQPYAWLQHSGYLAGRATCRFPERGRAFPVPAPMPLRSSQTGCAPQGHPLGQVWLEPQLVADCAADLPLKGVVTVLTASRKRRERVERAALIEVHQPEPPLLGIAEADDRAQQLRAESVVDQRGVHRVQVGHERLNLVRHV